MSTPAASTLVQQRGAQMFPTLDATQIATARRFGGEPRHFEPRQIVYALGERDAPAFLVLEGCIETEQRDGLGHVESITAHRHGQFSGEINQLAGAPTIAEGRAGPEGCTAVPFNAGQLRSLLIGSAEIGEILMRAYILRRVALSQTGAGIVLLGRADEAQSLRLQNFMRRNVVPHTVIDPSKDENAARFIERMEIREEDLPLAVLPSGEVLHRPTEANIACRVGLLPPLDPDKVFDVAIVGAGPAGLAAAVYAASEGLSVLVLDSRAFGGQAGASARIENYLGFPTGISGQALMGRAFAQAEKFGAVIAVPIEIAKLHCGNRPTAHWTVEPSSNGTHGGSKPVMKLHLGEGRAARATSIVAATGARYRRPSLPNLEQFEGRGVYYWASPIEARLCVGREVVLVGGGNSAGQAAVYLASHVQKVHVLVRGSGLASSMSRYLVDRLEALPNLELHTHSEVTHLIGDAAGDLSGIRWRNHRTGEEQQHDIRYLFLFIGADPNSAWLEQCGVAVDPKGFVRTGIDLKPADLGVESWSQCHRRPAPLETSQAGVFAVGDVRAGSVKRVAAAVGEGAAVVAQIHAYLAPGPASV
jgi:thioredoxin reductase (NADPH)